MKKTKRVLTARQKLNLPQEGEFLHLLEKEKSLPIVEKYLTSSLAMYVLLQAEDPMSVTINRLLKVEVKVAKIIDEYMKIQKKKASPIDLLGTLAGVLSFVRMGKVKEYMPPKPEKNLKKARTHKSRL